MKDRKTARTAQWILGGALLGGLLVLASPPDEAWAFPDTLQCRELQPGIATVTGAAQLPITGAFGTGSIMASPMMGVWVPWIMNLADCAAASVYVGETQIVSALNINFATLEQDEWQNDTNLLNGLTNMAVSREFGFAGNGQPSTAVAGSGCQSVDAAAEVVQGEETKSYTALAYRTAAIQYAQNVTARSQTAAHVNLEPSQAFTAATLFPPENSPPIDPGASGGSAPSGGPSGQAAEDYIQNLTDPTPPARPSSTNYATPAGRRYLAEMKVYDARMGLAQGALSQVAAWNTASYPLSGWLAKSLGAIGAPPPSVTPSGLVSEHQMMSALVDGRFANPNWYADIASESTSDLLREIAYMDAIRMKIELENYKMRLYQASIAASQYAGQSRLSPSAPQAVAVGNAAP